MTEKTQLGPKHIETQTHVSAKCNLRLITLNLWILSFPLFISEAMEIKKCTHFVVVSRQQSWAWLQVHLWLWPSPVSHRQLSAHLAKLFAKAYLRHQLLPPEKRQHGEVWRICTSDPPFSQDKRLNPPSPVRLALINQLCISSAHFYQEGREKACSPWRWISNPQLQT